MREHRVRIIYACLLIAESCWLYAALGVTGLIAAQAGSPLPWVAVFLLLAAGAYAGWVTMGIRGDPARLAVALGLAGLVCVYLAVAGGAAGGDGFDMLWAARLTGADMTAQRWAGTALSLAGAVLFWRRAVVLIADRYPEERLQRTFKLGIAAIAIAILAEQVSGKDLGAKTLLVPFFAVSLSGLAVARLPESGVGAKAASWTRVIAVSVLAVIGVGLALGLAGGVYGAGGVKLLYRGWGLLVDGLLWLIRYPLEVLVNAMLAFWMWVRSLMNPSGERIRLDPPSPPAGLPQSLDPSASGGPSLAETLVNILQYPLLIILIIVIFLALALAFRRLWVRRTKDTDEDRERIGENVDASADLAKLLKGLLPGWLHRPKEPGLVWRYPVDEPGVGEVFRLYFDYLSAAMRRGMEFDPAVTPLERVSALRRVLPEAPVESVTERFNAACYGREPTDQGTLAWLRSALEPATAGE